MFSSPDSNFSPSSDVPYYFSRVTYGYCRRSMSKRKRADTCATPSTATGTATSSSLPPRPSAAMAGNDDAWWAQVVKHTLDSVDTEDLDLDTKRRLNTALDSALGKAAKRACTDLLNADGFTCSSQSS